MIEQNRYYDLERKIKKRSKKKPAIKKVNLTTFLCKAEFEELERKQLLNQNPFRRPAYLKEIIDNNSQQLRYIYNKRLRRV
jgi:hypothetical protein